MITHGRYTVDGDDNLEHLIYTICTDVRQGIESIIPKHLLHGIALSGGYGRGEGGVLKSPAGDKPYNDVEFFVLLAIPNQAARFFTRPIRHMEAALTQKHGIDVECKLLSLRSLEKSAPTMFYYDLLAGHRLVSGSNSIFKNCGHHLDASKIPLSEATRLLMNRASGLLFAKHRLAKRHFTDDDADFVERNVAKACLALGDAELTAAGKYHWSCKQRHKIYRELRPDSLRLLYHRKGVKFKLHPHRSTASKSDLLRWHREICAELKPLFLKLESLRLEKPDLDAATYIHSDLSKCPEANTIKNRLINFREQGLAGLVDTTHPRENLLAMLCDFLWCRPDQEMKHSDIEQFTGLWHQFG